MFSRSQYAKDEMRAQILAEKIKNAKGQLRQDVNEEWKFQDLFGRLKRRYVRVIEKKLPRLSSSSFERVAVRLHSEGIAIRLGIAACFV